MCVAGAAATRRSTARVCGGDGRTRRRRGATQRGAARTCRCGCDAFVRVAIQWQPDGPSDGRRLAPPLSDAASSHGQPQSCPTPRAGRCDRRRSRLVGSAPTSAGRRIYLPAPRPVAPRLLGQARRHPAARPGREERRPQGRQDAPQGRGRRRARARRGPRRCGDRGEDGGVGRALRRAALVRRLPRRHGRRPGARRGPRASRLVPAPGPDRAGRVRRVAVSQSAADAGARLARGGLRRRGHLGRPHALGRARRAAGDAARRRVPGNDGASDGGRAGTARRRAGATTRRCCASGCRSSTWRPSRRRTRRPRT